MNWIKLDTDYEGSDDKRELRHVRIRDDGRIWVCEYTEYSCGTNDWDVVSRLYLAGPARPVKGTEQAYHAWDWFDDDEDHKKARKLGKEIHAAMLADPEGFDLAAWMKA